MGWRADCSRGRALAVAGVVLVCRAGCWPPSSPALWVAVTALVAVHGGPATPAAPPERTAEVAVSAGCLMLPVGGGLARALAAGGGRASGSRSRSSCSRPSISTTRPSRPSSSSALAGRASATVPRYRVVAGGAIAGPPLLAAGITFSPAPGGRGRGRGCRARVWPASAVLTLVRIVPRVPAGGPNAARPSPPCRSLGGMALRRWPTPWASSPGHPVVSLRADGPHPRPAQRFGLRPGRSRGVDAARRAAAWAGCNLRRPSL